MSKPTDPTKKKLHIDKKKMKLFLLGLSAVIVIGLIIAYAKPAINYYKNDLTDLNKPFVEMTLEQATAKLKANFNNNITSTIDSGNGVFTRDVAYYTSFTDTKLTNGGVGDFDNDKNPLVRWVNVFKFSGEKLEQYTTEDTRQFEYVNTNSYNYDLQLYNLYMSGYRDYDVKYPYLVLVKGTAPTTSYKKITATNDGEALEITTTNKGLVDMVIYIELKTGNSYTEANQESRNKKLLEDFLPSLNVFDDDLALSRKAIYELFNNGPFDAIVIDNKAVLSARGTGDSYQICF